MEEKKTTKSAEYNCLRNEKIIVRRLPKRTLLVQDVNHIMSDGMHDNAFRSFCVPKLPKSNNFAPVLSPKEQACLERVMGLPENALSIYRQPKEENYWSDANPSGLGTVVLKKQDNIFDLSKPTDYIAVKVLMANKDIICESTTEWEERPKETYEYVIIKANQEEKAVQDNTNVTINAVMKLGKITNDVDTLKIVTETMLGKKFSPATTPEYYQKQILDLIQSAPKNARLFLNIIKDSDLSTKALISKCVSQGLIADRGGYLYIKSSNSPMCEDGENPTINNAAKWLTKPANQEILFSLQAQLK